MSDVNPADAGLNDAALFDETVANPPLETPIEPEPPKPVEPSPPPEPAIPAGRLREEADARRAAERERDEYRRRYDDAVARQQPPPKAEPPKRSDLFEAPSAFVQEEVRPLIDPVQDKINAVNEQWSFRFAISEHGREKVIAAREAMGSGMGSRDPDAWAAYNRAMASLDPYGEIMRWHSGREVVSTVGNDLPAFLKSHEEKLLKDPEFQKRAYEQWRGQAASNGNIVNRPVAPKLPSIGKVGSAAPSNDADDNMSDEELFHATTRRR